MSSPYHKTDEPPAQPATSRKLPLAIGLLMLALLAWGLYLAVGAAIFRHQGDSFQFDPLRFGIVIACSVIFLGGWLFLLAIRRPRPPRTDLPLAPPDEEPPG